MSPKEYVEQLYLAVLRRPGDAQGIAHHAAEIERTKDPLPVLRSFMESDEFKSAAPSVQAQVMGVPAVSLDASTISHLHQIFICDGMKLPDVMPAKFVYNAECLKAAHPGVPYRLWDGHELREFVHSHFGREMVTCFDTLRPYAYKADLARLCLLHVYGGLYADLSLRFVNPLQPPDHVGIATFAAPWNGSPSWVSMTNGLIWSRPKRRELDIALNMIAENCRNRYYGTTCLYPTGPIVLGRAFVAAMAEKGQGDDADDQWMGTSRPLTPLEPQKNYCFVTPDSRLVAVSEKMRGADLSHLGAIGTNDYAQIWTARNVYGDED